MRTGLESLRSHLGEAGRSLTGRGARTLTVQVREVGSDKPVQGALLELTKKDKTFQATTDQAGDAIFAQPEMGRCTVSVKAEGYEDSATPLTVLTSRSVKIQLAPRYVRRLSIKAVEHREPVTSCRITLKGRFDQVAAKTDSDGKAEVENLRSGRRLITAEADLYQPISQEAEFHAPNETLTIRMVPLRADRIGFQAVDKATHLPVAGVRVVLDRTGEVFTLATGDKGDAELQRPKMGNYRMQVSHPLYGPIEQEMQLAQESLEKVLNMERLTGEISVKVLNSMTKKGIAAIVHLKDTENLGQETTQATDRGGLATLGRFPYAPYSLTIRAPGYLEVSLDLILRQASLRVESGTDPVITSTADQIRLLQEARSEMARTTREVRGGLYDRCLPGFFFNIAVEMISTAVAVACTPELYAECLDRQPQASDAAAKVASEAVLMISRMIKMPRNMQVYSAARGLPQGETVTPRRLAEEDLDELVSLITNPVEYAATGLQDQVDLNIRLEERMSTEISELDLYPVKYLQNLSSQMRGLGAGNVYEKAFSIYFSKAILHSCFQMVDDQTARRRLTAAARA